jgi:zinc and cadmium transporter
VDGILIASAFLIDAVVGVSAAIALIAHEIPQEIGDFVVLLDCGLSRAKALALNLASGATSIVGGIVGYFALEHAQHMTPYVLALAAASFIYIAVADLIPGLHRAMDARSTAWQIVLIAAGIVTVTLPHAMLH